MRQLVEVSQQPKKGRQNGFPAPLTGTMHWTPLQESRDTYDLTEETMTFGQMWLQLRKRSMRGSGSCGPGSSLESSSFEAGKAGCRRESGQSCSPFIEYHIPDGIYLDHRLLTKSPQKPWSCHSTIGCGTKLELTAAEVPISPIPMFVGLIAISGIVRLVLLRYAFWVLSCYQRCKKARYVSFS